VRPSALRIAQLLADNPVRQARSNSNSLERGCSVLETQTVDD